MASWWQVAVRSKRKPPPTGMTIPRRETNRAVRKNIVTHVRDRLQTISRNIPYNPINDLDSGGAVVGRKTRLPGFAIQEGGGLFNV